MAATCGSVHGWTVEEFMTASALYEAHGMDHGLIRRSARHMARRATRRVAALHAAHRLPRQRHLRVNRQ